MPFALINNPGFELQTTASAAPTYTATFGWQRIIGGTLTGVYKPSSAYYTGAQRGAIPEGDVVAFLNASPNPVFRQRLPYKIVQGATYTLRMKFGWPKTSTPTPGYDFWIQDAPSGDVLADRNSPGAIVPDPVKDQWVQAEISFTADAVYAGNALQIGFESTIASVQLDIDDVTLEVTGDPTFPETVVAVDDRDPEALMPSGVWTDLEQAAPGLFYNGALHWIQNAAGAFQWKPVIPETGEYQVLVFIPDTPSGLNTAVQYQVANATPGGSVEVNQQDNKGQWVDLGIHEFNAGNAGYVYLTTTTAVLMLADAIVCQKIPDVAPEVLISGVQASSGLGALVPQPVRNVSLGVLGVQALSGLGTLVPEAVRNASPPVLGVAASAQLGELLALVVGGNIALQGVEVASGAGTLTVEAQKAPEVPLEGVEATTGLGSLLVSAGQAPFVFLTGVQAEGRVGLTSIQIPGEPINIPLVGVAAQGVLGEVQVTAKAPTLVPIKGVSSQGQVGLLYADSDGWLPRPSPNPAWMREAGNDQIWLDEPDPITDWTEE